MSIGNEGGSRFNPEYLKRIEQFRLLDDTFFSTVFDKKPKPTQRMLRIILNRDDIDVLDVKAQFRIPNLLDHEITLDILAQDTSGKRFDVEVQRSSKGALPQRARYHLALMDARSLAKGVEYSELRDNYVIFITEEDTRRKNVPASRFERCDEDGVPLGDGSHIVYVNAAYRPAPGEITELVKLIHDFHCTAPEDMYIAELAEQVNYYKRTEGGIAGMCKIMEEFADEKTLNHIKSLMKNLNVTAEQAMVALDLPAEERKRLAAKL